MILRRYGRACVLESGGGGGWEGCGWWVFCGSPVRRLAVRRGGERTDAGGLRGSWGKKPAETHQVSPSLWHRMLVSLGVRVRVRVCGHVVVRKLVVYMDACVHVVVCTCSCRDVGRA